MGAVGGGGGGGLRSLASTLDNRKGFILGCENWDRYDFKALSKLVKSLVLLMWDTTCRKNKSNYMVIRIVHPLVALALVL